MPVAINNSPYAVAKTDHNDGLLEVVEKYACQIKHIFTGQRQRVMAKVDDLFAVYHPLGYGTMIISEVPTETEGECIVTVTRAYTCD